MSDSLVPVPRGGGRERLDVPLKKLAGPKAAAMAETLKLATVGDLLRHYPRRYVQMSELTDFASLPVNELVTLVADVTRSSLREMKTRRGQMLEVVVSDGRSGLHLTFFRQARFHHKRLTPGRRIVLTGKVGTYRGQLQLAQPSYEIVEDDLAPSEEELARLRARPIPVYPATNTVSSQDIAAVVRLVVDTLDDVADPLPFEVRQRHGLSDLTTALRDVHRPETMAQARAAQRRLRFEEAFVLQAALARRRAAAAEVAATGRRAREGGLLDAFDARLPFELTAGQRDVSEQIAVDMAREHPMHRLLQGEVGSGKTIVALRAMLTVVDAGGQAALLAPTEVLAVQHHRSITAMLGDLAEAGLLGGDAQGTRVALLTGSLNAAGRRKALLQAASGEAGIVVGTHALLQDRVQFADLGLVVVDEQHRFGVEQRTALRGKARTEPHVLVMTATPIPRTVAMTVFGDLDVSTLTELPGGRSPIATHVVPADDLRWVQRTWQRVREEVDAGHQAFVVCPRIGDDEEPGAKNPSAPDGGLDDGGLDEGGLDFDGPDGDAPDREERHIAGVVETVEHLRSEPALAGVRLAMLHGRMPADERDDVMRRFTRGEIDVLVATTVIEVGVDVPNATAMVVVDADRFGVSQLHQIRGRVGRGSAPGVCLLMTPVSADSTSGARLSAVAATLDGFALARVDLETRREGDVLGAAQSGGVSSLRVLSVLRDESVITAMRGEAIEVVAVDPKLDRHPELRRAIASYLEPEREAYLDRG